MSEDFLKDISHSIKIPADIVKAVAEPPAKQIGQSISDLLYILAAPITKKRAKIEHDIELFKNQIQDEISEIDPEKLVEPKLSVIGPAIEASKFYLEEEIIRKMFAKLIASSANSDFQDSTLPAFVEVIKQLSSFDANNIVELKQLMGKDQASAAARIIAMKRGSDSGFSVVENFIPFLNIDIANVHYYSASIDNLIRLGIIQMQHKLEFTDTSVYKIIKDHQFISQVEIELESVKKTKEGYEDRYLYLEPGGWKFTSFGKMLIECCL
jgi:hypothetical protein